MLGQLNECKPFRSTGKGGGSKKGKPQGKWPWPIKVAADAVFCCVKGGIEAWLKDRRKIISTEEFMRRNGRCSAGMEGRGQASSWTTCDLLWQVAGEPCV